MKTYTDHRKAVNARLDELGKSKYWLAQQLTDVMGDQMLYAYLRGRSTTTEKFEAICGVLGLKLAFDEGDGRKPEAGKGDKSKRTVAR